MRKKILFIIITLLIVLCCYTITSAYNDNVIYETNTIEEIGPDTRLEKITQFTEQGWISYSVIKTNLSNPYISVSNITGSNFSHPSNASDLAENANAIAAINASYFSYEKDGKKIPIGPAIERGNLITGDIALNYYNNTFASMFIGSNNRVNISYPSLSLMVTNKTTGTNNTANFYNKPYNAYDGIYIYTNKWDNYSIGTDSLEKPAMEIIITDGIVTKICENYTPINLTGRTTILACNSKTKETLKSLFKIGDNISINYSLNNYTSYIKSLTSGGSVLINNGKIPEIFTLPVNGRHPRTAIGTTQSGTEVIMITVDGRQDSSLGVSETELAELMKKHGAYNALCLDGGGSTTMIAKNIEKNNLEVINNPSDGIQRNIPNAIGIISSAPISKVSKLYINAKDSVMINTGLTLAVYGTDIYNNPINIDDSKVSYSFSGVNGYIKDSVFYPTTPGKVQITAQLGSSIARMTIDVIKTPANLNMNYTEAILEKESSINLFITGTTEDGYTIPIENSAITWQVSSGIGYFENNSFMATRPGTGYICGTVNNTYKVYCKITINDKKIIKSYDFSQIKASFLKYPELVSGSYSMNTSITKSDGTSGKLSYVFPLSESSRAAYIGLNNVEIPYGTDKIGFWVYNTSKNSNQLKGMITDIHGNNHRITFESIMNWTQWKYVEASIAHISMPTALSRLYTVQTHDVFQAGTLFIDDIQMINLIPPTQGITVPKNTLSYSDNDLVNQNNLQQNAYDKIAIMSINSIDANPYEKSYMNEFLKDLSIKNTVSYLITDSIKNIGITIKNNVPNTKIGRSVTKTNSSTIINLDTINSSLYNYKNSQWKWFINALETDTKNIFIIMKSSPELFNDSKEYELFTTILEKQYKDKSKTIWVISSGDTYTSKMYKGVKYISLPDYGIDNDNKTPSYIQINVDAAGNATYGLVSVN